MLNCKIDIDISTIITIHTSILKFSYELSMLLHFIHDLPCYDNTEIRRTCTLSMEIGDLERSSGFFNFFSVLFT